MSNSPKKIPWKSIWKTLRKDTIFCNVVSGIILLFVGLLFAKNDNVKQVIHELLTPDVIVYSHEIQNKAAQEVRGGKCPALTQFAIDYGVMRDQARVIKGEDIPK